MQNKVEWVKINDSSYLCIAIEVNNIRDKDVRRFGRINFNVAVSINSTVTCSDYSFTIFHIDSHPSVSISDECLEGIKDYILGKGEL